ncbi:MAG: hypothetical protein KDE58_09460, partial [Caldilineaceae bacterium]|nr:hypothetical protein [Caldilineaceae bacterium]
MRNKGWLLIATLLVSALLVTACPAAAPVAETGAQPAADGAEASDAGMSDEAVTISIWHGWAGEYYANIEQVFQEYMDAHPNVTIELSKPDNLGEAAKVAIPAGEGPDIFAWANDSIGDQALSGNIVPLNDLGIDQEFLENTYEPAAVNGVVWQGQIWGLPESQEGIALV